MGGSRRAAHWADDIATDALNRPSASAALVRRSDLVALALLLLGLLLAGLAAALPEAATILQGFAGFLLLGALLAVLARFLGPPAARPGVVFRAPGSRERWCTFCGQPAPLGKPCVSCGKVPFSMRRKQARLDAKSSPPAQEKKTKN